MINKIAIKSIDINGSDIFIEDKHSAFAQKILIMPEAHRIKV